MKFSHDLIGFLFFLMPGIFLSASLSMLWVRDKKSGVSLVIETFFFSFLVYLVMGALGPDLTNFQWNEGPQILSLSLGSVLWSLGVAIILTGFIGWSVNFDLHMKFLRAIGLTQSTARLNTWLDVFQEHGDHYVIVYYRDGSRIWGWPKHVSNNKYEGLLFLCDAAYINDSDPSERKYVDIDGPGILINFQSDQIKSVQFTSASRENAELGA